MTTEPNKDAVDPEAAAAALKAQGVPPALENKESKSEQGNNPPPPVQSEAPKPELTDAEKEAEAAAAAKEAEAKEAEAKAKEAAEAEETPGDEPALDHEVWGTTGNEVADSVLQLMQNADVTPEEAKALMFDAVQAGDATQIDRDALVAKVGKAKATLIMAGVTNFISDQKTRNQTILNEVYGATGGEDNWKAMAAWGKENLPEAALTEYRSMIDAGGAQARFAAAEIAKAYNADPKNTSLDTGANPPLEGDGVPPPGARATTREEYCKELNAAHRGNPTEAQLNEITAARHRGRAKGI